MSSKLYGEIYKLKNILRKGWLVRNVGNIKTGRVESDAEHTFSMCMLAMEIMAKSDKYKNLDQLKVYKMILVHELCEIDAGDHTPYDKITLQEKFDMELACVKRLAKECKMPELLNLWLEFEENKSPEAMFVKKMDKLDAIMQAKIYSEERKNDAIFNDFKNYTKNISDEFDNYL